ncbi:AraC family transcriptional regulator [Rhizobacter sp. Root1221]|uniref:helix-turn-helix transcriptional regulator n=1 Tax=Rhizobacter sp. Root1221 TaxID=1736433 RepID=UPI0006FBF183|nr:AraC family transcriptional regulator [Rhizobacter sp. Root1221]KQV98017.1 AraC family transcriptional regulator [Rhizobacter sp. Root1221]
MSHRCRWVVAPWDGVHCTDIESDRHFGRHWHDTFGVGLVVDGAQHSASGRGDVDAYAGDLIATNPGEVHDGRPIGGSPRRWRMLYLSPAAMAAFTDTHDLRLTRPVMQDPQLAASLGHLFQRLAVGDATPLANEEALVTICAQLMARHTTTRPPCEAADAAMDSVRDRLAAEGVPPPTLAELAEATGLSRFQLLRRFEKLHGVPPHAWGLLRRAERARGLIARGSSLADAAADTGFADQSHMTRQFNRHFGFTPGAWRQATTHR